MLFSKIMGKKVLAIAGATFVGQVKGLYIEKKTYTVKYICLSNENMPILAYVDLFGFGDILTIKSCDCLMDISTVENCIYYTNGLGVYDVDGNLMGESFNLNMKARYNARDFSIKGSGESIKLKSIIASSSTAIVINPRNRALTPRKRQIAIVKKVDKQQDIKDNADRETIEITDAKEIKDDINNQAGSNLYEEITFRNNPEITYNPPEQERVSNDYSFLLGRKVERDVTDITRTFVIKMGTIINDRVIESIE